MDNDHFDPYNVFLAIATNIPPRLKGIVHPKMKMLSLFTHPYVIPNLYECLCSAEHKGRYFKECGKQQFWGTIFFHSIICPTMEVNGAPKQPCYKFSSKYLPSCLSEQRNSYRFGTPWGWVNDDRIFIFWVNYPFKTGFVVQGHIYWI